MLLFIRKPKREILTLELRYYDNDYKTLALNYKKKAIILKYKDMHYY
jgi:hypothetical protein